MSRKLISSGSPFEQKIGYSRAVVDGRWVFVSGTTGFDYARMTISEEVVEQARQCFHNLADALAQAGASLTDVVQARYILTRREDFEPIWPVISKHFADVRPTCTMFVAGLADPRMLVEIEVTALKATD
jgi:enamine deaminase RidA (YjgF/YER057c/UK114 family)